MKRILLSVSIMLIAAMGFGQDGPKGLQVNDVAPLFTATDQNGKVVNLEEKLKTGPVVLVFYRGHWCPYCNRQLKKIEDSLSLITGKGASIIAVSPEKPESVSKTLAKTKVTFPILSDENLKIMKSYAVVFTVDPGTVEKYKGYGIDFNEVNGDANGANLPVPAVYIINKDRKIVFRHFDNNYTKRASVAEIAEQL